MQVYDLAWSPSGEYIVAGSTDNTARIFATADGAFRRFKQAINSQFVLGKCVHEIAEHFHYVQGVAWDPLNEYIATQSSDRSMHIYRITTKPGGAFEVHAVGKNTRMPHRHSHSRTPSAHGNAGKTKILRTESVTSDAESNFAIATDLDDVQSTSGGAPLTPALSIASTPSFAIPPPPVEASSRRSSFSSNAPGSPTTFTSNSRYARSPSPMPPLPAIRGLPSPSTSAAAALWASVKLYGDESYTNFFRRLAFSPDGGLLLTPAGQFEDPSVNPPFTKSGEDSVHMRGRRGHPSEGASSNSSSCVYIYSRANFARPPIAQLPGHQKASVAVRFSPILYDLRPGVLLSSSFSTTEHEEKERQSDVRRGDEPPTGLLAKGIEGSMDVDMVGPSPGRHQQSSIPLLLTPHKTSAQSAVISPNARPSLTTSDIFSPSPMLSPLDLRPPTPAASKPSTPLPLYAQTPQSQSQPLSGQGSSASPTGSLFSLPYRLLFAVVTMDTVAIYDTQQASPICLLTKLHYDEFTDMSWYVAC